MDQFSKLEEDQLNSQSQSIQEDYSYSKIPKIKVVANFSNECPQIKNHSSVLYKRMLYLFGGYDGKKNHNSLHIYDLTKNEWIKGKVCGKEPEGRNGHTATLIENKMYIIGGWLGSGTYAANDMYVLNLDTLEWNIVNTTGEAPGPCNMHSADLIGKLIYVFRGGDGKDYLNDLHIFNPDTKNWKCLNCDGSYPPPRANHSSAVLGNCLYIFGGWDGSKRLNDLHALDSDKLTWMEIPVYSMPPSPRAGMSLSAINSLLYLFGGSGPSATCFNDLQIFDPTKKTWTQADMNDMSKIKPRAGHSMTTWEDKLFIMGGSYGQQYYRDFYIIDTNPAPEIKIRSENSQNRLKTNLRDYCNKKEFSDVTFMIEGRPFYGHKVILSLLCEKFKVMFNSGMKEANEEKIEIKHISYPVFAAVCQYLYTGDVHFGAETEGQELSLDYLLEFLSVSDEFILDDIKFECEKQLINLIIDKNCEKIYEYADKFNAIQLKTYCKWFQKKNNLNCFDFDEN